MSYGKTLPSATFREHGGEERGVSPRAPEQARPETEDTDGSKHVAALESKLEAGKALANQRVRQVERFGMKIIESHRSVSRECTDADVRRIVMDAFMMNDLFGKNTVALAHPQVTDKDPLRFFVLAGLLFPNALSTVIVNPRITRHVNYTVDSKEGCHTWPEREHVVKQRHRLIDVEYQTCDADVLSPIIKDELKGLPAFVFQHELDHLNAIYCYD